MSRSRSNKKQNSLAADESEMPFHVYGIITLTSGAQFTYVAPSAFGNRIATIADGWTSFRLKKLKFRLIPSGTITVNQQMAFVVGNPDTIPSTAATIGELYSSVVLGVRQTVYTNWGKVNAKELAGPLPWYQTNPGSAASNFECPGLFVWCGTGSEAVTYEIRGVICFKGSVDPANTPLASEYLLWLRAERARRQDAAEKSKLVKVLATPSDPAKPPSPIDGKRN